MTTPDGSLIDCGHGVCRVKRTATGVVLEIMTPSVYEDSRHFPAESCRLWINLEQAKKIAEALTP